MSPITPRLLRTSALRNLTSSIRPAAARIAAGGYGRLGGYGRIAENPRTFTQTCQWRKEEGRVAPALDAKEAQGAQTESKLYSFEEIRDFAEKPNPNRILIDVREPSELRSTGRIPSAINIPVTTAPDAFFLPEEEFEDKFGFERPSKDTEVVFYCKAGVRSRAAAGLAREAGWKRTSEFRGAWNEWFERGGRVERS